MRDLSRVTPANSAWARLAGLESRPGIAPDLLRLESRLLDWRVSFQAKIRTHYPEPKPDSADWVRSVESGGRLTEVVEPLPRPSLLSAATGGFLEATGSLGTVSQTVQRWIFDATHNDSRDEILSRWFTASWKEDDPELRSLSTCGTAELEPDVLGWAGSRVAQPFFHRLGELAAGAPALESWDPKHRGCPCCGRAPGMGRYRREDGRRFLWCSLCDLQWTFPRVTCPFCASTGPAKLGNLRVEGVEHHRVDVCDSCWGYLRIVDERARPAPADLTREEVATTYLCAIAEQRGYRQGRLSGPTAAISPTSIVERTH